MNLCFRASLRRLATGTALGLSVMFSATMAHAENRIYAGTECSLSEVSGSLQDRGLGKLQSNSSLLQTVVCPVHHLDADNTLDLVEVDIVGDPGDAQCRVYRRAPSGSAFFSNVDAISLVNSGINLWRHTFWPGSDSFTMGSGQSVAIQCTLGSGSSVLRYRAVIN